MKKIILGLVIVATFNTPAFALDIKGIFSDGENTSIKKQSEKSTERNNDFSDIGLSLNDESCFSKKLFRNKGKICHQEGKRILKFISNNDSLSGLDRIRLYQKGFKFEYRACYDFGVPQACKLAFFYFSKGYRPFLSKLFKYGPGALNPEQSKLLDKGYTVIRKHCLATKDPKSCYIAGAIIFKIGDMAGSKKYLSLSCQKGYKKACKVLAKRNI